MWSTRASFLRYFAVSVVSATRIAAQPARTSSLRARWTPPVTLAPGTQRKALFGNTAQADHLPVNDFSVYYTDTIDVSVKVSATDAD